MPIDVRRAGDRFESRGDGVISRHSFSYGPHYDPSNTRFGALVSHNDDLLDAGSGFPDHPHRDLEIVTWVIEGAIEHTDSVGGHGVIRPGMVGRFSTGVGVRHSEVNASSGVTRSLQMWLLPDADRPDADRPDAEVPVAQRPASYETADLSGALAGGAFACAVAGASALFIARLAAGTSVALPSGLRGSDGPNPPASALLHVFVAVGRVVLAAPGEESVTLDAGDAVRATDAGPIDLDVVGPAEVLVWVLPDR